MEAEERRGEHKERVFVPLSAIASPSGHAHMPGEGRALMAPVDDEIVALGLA